MTLKSEAFQSVLNLKRFIWRIFDYSKSAGELMYLVSNTVRAVPGRLAEAFSVIESLYETMKPQPGFGSARLLHSLAEPDLYSISLRWESRAASETWRTSEEREAQVRDNPLEGLTVPVAPPRAAEVVGSVGEDEWLTPGGFFIVVWDIDQGAEAARAFVNSRMQLFNLLKEHDENYLGGVIYRSMGDPRMMIVAHGLADAEEGLGLRNSDPIPGVAEIRAANPPGNFSSTGRPVIINRWEVAMRVTP
jgi:heme-degrading monooxygenase HmoA